MLHSLYSQDTSGRRNSEGSTQVFMSSYSLTHLKQLEAESIHIIREVAAEFHNPVMLYSIGKDSSVMVQLAMKAFYPAKPPFPLMHIDTTWKFREMIEFRESYVREQLGLELLVYINEEGCRLGLHPLEDSEKHTEVMKTDALEAGARQCTSSTRPSAVRARRGEVAGQGTRLFLPRPPPCVGPKNQRPELWNLYNAKVNKGRAFGSSVIELDRVRRLQYIHLEQYPDRAIVLCGRAARGHPRPRDDHGRRRTVAAASGREASDEARSLPHARLHPLTGAIESNATTLPDIIRKCC